VLVAGCGGGARDSTLPGIQGAQSTSTQSTSILSASEMNASYPESQSPASFTVAPMPLNQRLPASEMLNAVHGITPQSIGLLSWSKLPGSAIRVAGALDGSLWALSPSPAGVNKSIWHYASGAWTNIPGSAASIAVGPTGTLYAVNGTTGGVYSYNGTSWSPLGGGANWVAAGADGAIYVLSNAHVVNGNSAIWKNAGGVWTQQPGSGSQLAGSFDSNTYTVAGVGTVAPNGYFVANSGGGIYYFSPGTGYVRFPGAASGIAPITGGVFALGYPPAAGGKGLYYFDYVSAGWTAEPGSGVTVASGAGTGGTGTQLYVVNAANAVWATPVVASGGGGGTLSVVDYFTGAAIPNVTATLDGTNISGPTGTVTLPALTTGLHTLAVTANNYATYNNAIQVPGGTTTRTIPLFPVSSALSGWLAQINTDRAANGAGPVALDDGLTIAAFDHAADMGVQGYFAHFDPIGYAPTTRSLLLGAMLEGAENLADGYSNWTAAEAAFMAEKSQLPNQSPADCAQFDSLAGHYCNIVSGPHNWVGIAIAQVSGGTVNYDQEFGDLYGYYDTTVTPAAPAVGTSTSVAFAAANGATLSSDLTASLSTPVAISIATLNADPTCSTQCPAADTWFPGNENFINAFPLPISFTTQQIYFGQLQVGGVAPWSGFGANLAAIAGGSALLPPTYTNAAFNVTSQLQIMSPNARAGRIVPYTTKMRSRLAR
jgi:hypothetical protein